MYRLCKKRKTTILSFAIEGHLFKVDSNICFTTYLDPISGFTGFYQVFITLCCAKKPILAKRQCSIKKTHIYRFDTINDLFYVLISQRRAEHISTRNVFATF